MLAGGRSPFSRRAGDWGGPAPGCLGAASTGPGPHAGGTASAGAWSAGILAGTKPQKPVPRTLPPRARRPGTPRSAAGRPAGLPV